MSGFVSELVRDPYGVAGALEAKTKVLWAFNRDDPARVMDELCALEARPATAYALFATRLPDVLDQLQSMVRGPKRQRTDGPSIDMRLRVQWAASLRGFDGNDTAARADRVLCDVVDQLSTTGVTVMPIPKAGKINAAMAEYFASIPERRSAGVPADDEVAMSNYGILGEASAAHSPGARLARKWHYRTVVPVVARFLQAHGLPLDEWHFQQLLDRVMRRAPGKVPAGESAHRDQAIGADPAGVVFGGWVQLAGAPSTFSFVAGSHRTADGSFGSNRDGGFAKEPLQPNQAMKRVTVPPGHLIMFWANILHEVSARKPPTQYRHLPNARVFVGGYLSPTGRALHHESAPVLAKNNCRATAADAPNLKRITVRGALLKSPSSEEAMDGFLTVPTPSGQQFGIATAFK
jgi:hypothetical protein